MSNPILVVVLLVLLVFTLVWGYFGIRQEFLVRRSLRQVRDACRAERKELEKEEREARARMRAQAAEQYDLDLRILKAQGPDTRLFIHRRGR